METQPPLRAFQKQALEALRHHSGVVCVAPTGSGKTRIITEHMGRTSARTIVISPLVAIQDQQRLQFEELGLGAIFMSPESLDYAGTWSMLREFDPTFVVVDEAHTLWEWGESFRPSHHLVWDLLKQFPKAKSLFLTATLPREAWNDFEKRSTIGLHRIGAFDLPKNIRIDFVSSPYSRRLTQVSDWVLSQMPSQGMIYAHTREGTERLSRALQGMGIAAIAYHAGLSRDERTHRVELLQRNHAQVIICTSAFGMGLDLKCLNWLVITHPPSSMLSLAQLFGRVGRSGQLAHVKTFWDPQEFYRVDPKVAAYYQSLRCRRSDLIQYFEAVEVDSTNLNWFRDDCIRGGHTPCDLCESRVQYRNGSSLHC